MVIEIVMAAIFVSGFAALAFAAASVLDEKTNADWS